MKRYLILLLTLFALSSCEQEPEIIGIDADKKMPKVDVCHYDANTDTWKTISINENALKAHLDHGDYEGDCGERKTYVPDEAFEQYFINEGYDDVIDQHVLTSKLQEVTEIVIHEWVPQPAPDMAIELLVKDFTGIEDCINLETFYCYKYLGTNFKLSNKPYLKSFYVRDWEDISNLELINLPILEEITFEGTSINSLDLSTFSNLNYVWIMENWNLENVDLRNNNNGLISNFTSRYNEMLNCFSVDDAAYSELNWTNVDPWTTFSEDCGY